MKSYVVLAAVGAIIGAAVNGMPVLDNHAAVGVTNAQGSAQAVVTGIEHNIHHNVVINSSIENAAVVNTDLVVHDTKSKTAGLQHPVITLTSCTVVHSPTRADWDFCRYIKTTLSDLTVANKTTLEQAMNAAIATATPTITAAPSTGTVISTPAEHTTSMGIDDMISSWCATATRSDGSKPYICTVSINHHADPTHSYSYKSYVSPTYVGGIIELTTVTDDITSSKTTQSNTSTTPIIELTTITDDIFPGMATSTTLAPLATSSTEIEYTYANKELDQPTVTQTIYV
ncbi:hypothetical protein CORC01_00585 [Colletotrichum orchidophilum]|uniref:Uncharacterized protein n=1 Tax=Colletotrichum orchidophilum TaxID=1209926 RepID=A0A1G4BSE4_9PEZI|nr:uncharacterized protein CORC01_00585 [Colletotrichum orchidophilum]OHF04246.1 hypothetical protein CORC01_00585 [Colletotrichum orchidophilum]